MESTAADQARSAWSGLGPVPGLLAPGLKAPIPLPKESGSSYRRFLARLLENLDIPSAPLEAALSTASTILQGAQVFLEASHRLIVTGGTVGTAQEACVEILRVFSGISQARNAAYVMEQVAGIALSRREMQAPAIALERPPRLKDFMTPLETRLEELRVPARMEDKRYAALVVHLDEFYDDSSLEIQRTFALAARPLAEARILTPEYLQHLYRELVRASFADHVLALYEKEVEPGRGTGLLTLLPELVRVLDES